MTGGPSPNRSDWTGRGIVERCWPGSGQGQEFEFIRLVGWNL
jgi:hypothetical protein